METSFYAPISGIATFGGYPVHEDLDTIGELNPDMVVLGVPNDLGSSWRNGSKFGPKRVREATACITPSIDGCYDWERDEVFLDPKAYTIIDGGDVSIVTGDLVKCHEYTEEAVRKIVAAGAVPAIIGGDHAITIPCVKAMDSYDDLCVIQFDAHLDWAYAPGGQKYCHNSPMRRSAEMDHVTKMAQIGIRGLGSSRRSDFDDARAFGSVLVSAKEANRLTPEELVSRIPEAKNYYVSIDIDGLDGSIVPGTGTPAPGGLLFDTVNDALYEICKRGNVVGFDLVEVAPVLDASGFTDRVAAMLMINFMGYIMKFKSA